MFELLNDINDRVNYPLLVEMPHQSNDNYAVGSRRMVSLYNYCVDNYKTIRRVKIQVPEGFIVVAFEHPSNPDNTITACLDTEQETAVYFSTTTIINIPSIGRCRQQKFVESIQTSAVGKRMPYRILFDVYLTEGPVASDGLHSVDGRKYWQSVIEQSFQMGINIYSLNMRTAELTHYKSIAAYKQSIPDIYSVKGTVENKEHVLLVVSKSPLH